MKNIVLILLLFLLLYSCARNELKKNDNIDLIKIYSLDVFHTEDDTNNNFSSIMLEGISNTILFVERSDELVFNYKDNIIRLIYFNKLDKNEDVNSIFYFNGGIYTKEEIYKLIEASTFQNNINNVRFINYFILSTQEYSDIRLERDLIINTNDNVVLISIKNYNLIDKIINENRQYFKIYDGNNFIPYDNDDIYNVNDKNFNTWPCWDHENNAIENFLKNCSNKKNGEFANLWFQETEDIINRIKLE